MPTREQLPQDKVTLQDMVLELLTTIQRSRLNEDELRHRIAMLLRRIYGPRTERFDPNQGSLFDEAADGQDQTAPTEPATPPPTEPASRAKRKARPHGRRKLPKDLPRREQHHTLTEAERFRICGCLRIDIGADRSEQLDWQPASYFVWPRDHLGGQAGHADPQRLAGAWLVGPRDRQQVCKCPANPVLDMHGLILRKGGGHVHYKTTRST